MYVYIYPVMGFEGNYVSPKTQYVLQRCYWLRISIHFGRVRLHRKLRQSGAAAEKRPPWMRPSPHHLDDPTLINFGNWIFFY